MICVNLPLFVLNSNRHSKLDLKCQYGNEEIHLAQSEGTALINLKVCDFTKNYKSCTNLKYSLREAKQKSQIASQDTKHVMLSRGISQKSKHVIFSVFFLIEVLTSQREVHFPKKKTT